MARLGLDYERLRGVNRRLVYCAITGYGQDGPYRARAGHDVNYLGVAGVLGVNGTAGGPPAIPGVQVADLGGGQPPGGHRHPARPRRARADGRGADGRMSR